MTQREETRETAAEKTSKYGAGVVVCLAKFSEHLWGSTTYDERMIRDYKSWLELPERGRERKRAEAARFPKGDAAQFLSRIEVASIGEEHSGPEGVLSHLIELWMNAASDHFYDLDHERAPEPLRELADLTLEIGHGFTGKTWTYEHVERIRELWRESCLALDEQLGVKADWGRW